MKLVKRIALVLLMLYIAVTLLIYFNQDKFLFHPYILARDYAFSFPNQRFKEAYLVMPTGDSISYLTFWGDSPVRGVVVYFHGNGECIDRTGKRIKPLTQRGYDVVVMDYPGYGKSSPRLASMEGLFAMADTFVQMAKNKYYPDNTVIYGMSLGTGIAAHAARKQEWFKTLILEAPYYSIVQEAKRRYPILPVGPLCKYPISTYQYLRDIQHPVYIIHGADDWVIPPAASEGLMAIPNNNLHRMLVPLAGHTDLPKYPEYNSMLHQALK
jgi:uncharacterized protein